MAGIEVDRNFSDHPKFMKFKKADWGLFGAAYEISSI